MLLLCEIKGEDDLVTPGGKMWNLSWIISKVAIEKDFVLLYVRDKDSRAGIIQSIEENLDDRYAQDCVLENMVSRVKKKKFSYN